LLNKKDLFLFVVGTPDIKIMFGYISFAIKSVYITCILKHPITVETRYKGPCIKRSPLHNERTMLFASVISKMHGKETQCNENSV